MAESQDALDEMSASLMSMLLDGGGSFGAAPTPPPAPVEAVETSLESHIRTQVEFYFGDQNYRRDRFLRSKEDDESFVLLSVLMGFAKVTSLSSDPDVVFNALRRSTTLVLREEGRRSRGIRRAEPLKEEPVDQRPLPERVAEVCTEFDKMLADYESGSAIASLGMRPLRQLAGLAAWTWRGNEPLRLARICTPPLLAATEIATTLICAEESSVLCHEYLQIIDNFIGRSIGSGVDNEIVQRSEMKAFHQRVRGARAHHAELKQHEKNAANAARQPLTRQQSDAYSSEMVGLVHRIAPLDGETARIKEVVRAELQALLIAIAPGWSECAVKTYGSTNSTLGFASSDVDCCLCIDPSVDIGETIDLDMDFEETDPDGATRRLDADGLPIPDSFEVLCIKAAKRAVSEAVDSRTGRAVFGEIEAITTARVPILKTKHLSTGVELDLCVNQLLPLQNTSLLRTYVDCDDRVRPLALFIKYWAKARGVNDSSNGTLSSYAWVMMVVFFLQRHTAPVLPNLQSPKLVGRTPVIISTFDASFCNDTKKAIAHMRAGGDGSGGGRHRGNARQRAQRSGPSPVARRDGSIVVPPNSDSLAELLAAFFRFYAFEFNMGAHVVCPRLGRLKWLAKDGVDRRMRAPRKWRFAIEDVRRRIHSFVHSSRRSAARPFSHVSSLLPPSPSSLRLSPLAFSPLKSRTTSGR